MSPRRSESKRTLAPEPDYSLREGPGVALTPEDAAAADLIVHVRMRRRPVAGDAPVEDWALTDETGTPLKDYADARDAIFERVNDLARRLDT